MHFKNTHTMLKKIKKGDDLFLIFLKPNNPNC